MSNRYRPDRIRVGLSGAGPWARRTHIPALSGSSTVEFVGIWTRTSQALSSDIDEFRSFNELLDACDAIGFAVPPEVQVALAGGAARAGKALLLEKPLGPDLASARRLADAVAESGVISIMALILRFAPEVQAFLDEVRRIRPIGGSFVWISGGHNLATPRSPWRVAGGPLLDVGPHVLDLLEAALGPIERIRAHGRPSGWTGLLLDHAGGAVSEASLCVPLPHNRPERFVRIVGEDGTAELDLMTLAGDAFDHLVSAFAHAIRTGTPHPLDAAHGLHLQELIETAQQQLDPA